MIISGINKAIPQGCDKIKFIKYFMVFWAFPSGGLVGFARTKKTEKLFFCFAPSGNIPNAKAKAKNYGCGLFTIVDLAFFSFSR